MDPYLYGAYFHEFLGRTYGDESIRRLTEETGRRIPYLGSRAYKKVFGKSLGQLWNDFESVGQGRGEARAREPRGPTDPTRIPGGHTAPAGRRAPVLLLDHAA